MDKLNSSNNPYQGKKYSFYMGNLNLRTSESDLKKLIQSVGVKDIVEVKLMKDEYGQTKGYAVVHLQYEASKISITEKLSSVKFHGKNLRVLQYNKKNKRKLEKQYLAFPKDNPQIPPAGQATSVPPPGLPLPLPSTSVKTTDSCQISLDDMPPVDLPPFINTKVPPPPGFPPPYLAPPFFPPPHFPPPQLPLLPQASCAGVSDPEDAMARNRATSSIAIDWAMEDANVGKYSSAVCLLENAASMLKQSALIDDFRTKFLIDSVEHCLCVVKEHKREASVGDQGGLDDDSKSKPECPPTLDQNGIPGNSGKIQEVTKTAVGRGRKIVAVIFVVMIAIFIAAVFIYPSFNL